MSKYKKDNYIVGYKKTPVDTRFKKGESGNPKGRKKKPPKPSFIEIFVHEGSKMVTITENGQPLKLSQDEVIARRLHHEAM